MSTKQLRVGLIGAGGNTKLRHIPGLLALEGVEIVAVCNRRPESSAAVASAYSIPRTFADWHELIAAPDVDAVIVGTWPYLHCPIVLAALAAGKHVLTEARMSMDAAEAHAMLVAARQHPQVVTQVVPSPFGMKGNLVMRELIAAGYLGELHEVQVFGQNGALADAAAPLSWRQDAALSGYNMLTLGILHETLLRWVAPPVRVLAQVHAFVAARIDPSSGARRPVGTPDCVQVLSVLQNGARATYHFSGATSFGQRSAIHLYGTQGALHYDLIDDRIFGASQTRGEPPGKAAQMQEIAIPAEKAGAWRVEEEFVQAIREGTPVSMTDFATGVQYMEFTEAVVRSAERGEAVELPLGQR
jgi:predicted dehydrogenase